ncbi:unnamed protein product [Fraxinus pennsylvanica]|uniref:Uncharacterized protein n=1 Tax=Fraxinus pennsylvanica TaxID=56036 RepID=A0AAD1Z5L2_9LAMI|nr:unnamed protein product [Fraxinus pennsylvanica]
MQGIKVNHEKKSNRSGAENVECSAIEDPKSSGAETVDGSAAGGAMTGSNGIVVRSGQDSQSYASYMLRKPVILPPFDGGDGDGESAKVDSYYESENKSGDGDTLVDLEDQILAVTVPLVDIVRIILHSGKYENGDKLSPEHKRTILERLLPYHPEFVKKIGCGVDYITIDDHPNFEGSRCLFIVRNDGELVDFSYWKCIKGLIQKKYPLYADRFILRHYRIP